MKDKLKPCPFCGSGPVYLDDWNPPHPDKEDWNSQYPGLGCSNVDCGLSQVYMHVEKWNCRPAEKAVAQRIEEQFQFILLEIRRVKDELQETRDELQNTKYKLFSLVTSHEEEVEEFNAGYNAALQSKDQEASELEYRSQYPMRRLHDVFRIGYTWGMFGNLTTRNARDLLALRTAKAGRSDG